MQDKPTPPFSHFMRDTDGEYSKAAILKAARALLAEDRRPDRVEMALIKTAFELAGERGQDGRFLRNVRDWAGELYEKSSQTLKQLEAERRNTAN